MEMMGMAYNTVRQYIVLTEVGSLAVLKPKAVERKAGQKCKLTQQQEEQVQRLMCDKRPDSRWSLRCGVAPQLGNSLSKSAASSWRWGCKNFCVNGQMAGNCCTLMEMQINDRHKRTNRQPAG
jgi:hypothetical protein